MNDEHAELLRQLRDALWSGGERSALETLAAMLDERLGRSVLPAPTPTAPESGTRGELLLAVVIPGEPVGKARPRVVMNKKLGRAMAFTPERTQRWENYACDIFRLAWGQRGPLDEPVAVEALAVKGRPKRLLRKRDPSGRLWRVTKPDGDNVVKCVGDALKSAGVVRDDARIAEWIVRSGYARRDEGPSVRVELYRLVGIGPPALADGRTDAEGVTTGVLPWDATAAR